MISNPTSKGKTSEAVILAALVKLAGGVRSLAERRSAFDRSGRRSGDDVALGDEVQH